jgi:hypothetical protein
MRCGGKAYARPQSNNPLELRVWGLVPAASGFTIDMRSKAFYSWATLSINLLNHHRE